MSIDGEIIEEQVLQAEEQKKAMESELKRDIEVGVEYELMKRTLGWKRLEKAILERSSSLSSRLLTVNDEKALFRVQGELLGIQSVLNIVDTAMQIADEAKNILKGDENNG